MSEDTGVFSRDKDHLGHRLVYINGVAVPTESAAVAYGDWQIPEATLNMAPDPVLERIGAEDRMQVEIYFLDDYDPARPPTFRVLYEGEVVGWGYEKSSRQRQTPLPCVNQFAIFTQLTIQMLLNVDDMAAQAVEPGRGVAGASPTRSELVFPYSLFTQGLIGSDRVARPFDFVYNIVRWMTGTTVPEAQRAVPSCNFFSRWARLCNFVNRFVACPAFDDGTGDNIFPILQALQTTSAVDAICRTLIGQVQSAGTMYDMLQVVLQNLYTQVVMLPAAPAVQVDLATSAIRAPDAGTFNLREDAGAFVASAPDPLKPRRIANYFVKPQAFFGLPPACNVIFPSMIESVSYSENYATQPTRLYFQDEVVNRLFRPQGQLDPAVLSALTRAYPPEADALQQARDVSPGMNAKNFLIFPEEFYKGPVLDKRPLPTWLFFLRQAEEARLRKQKEDPVPVSADVPAREQPKSVYQLYAEYEFFRERYSRRAGTVVCKFNPFVVPGFPGLVFADAGNRVHFFCSFVRVQHVMGSRSMQTVISFGYGRMVTEMMDLLRTEFAGGSAAIATAPPEPISPVRDALQHFEAADAFYRTLLYQAGNNDRAAVCVWTQMLAYRADVEGADPEPIIIDGANEAGFRARDDAAIRDQALAAQELTLTRGIEAATSEARQVAATAEALRVQPGRTAAEDTELQQLDGRIAAASKLVIALGGELSRVRSDRQAIQAQLRAFIQGARVTHNLDATRELVPSPAFREAFTSFDAAMAYVWRPICSLDEAIAVHGKRGEDVIPASGSEESLGAPYYRRTRRLTSLAAGQPVPSTADGLLRDASGAVAPAANPAALPADFPQARADWDAVLTAYRTNVESELPRRG